MNEQELLTTLKARYAQIGEVKDSPSENFEDGTLLRHRAVAVFDDVGGVLMRQWVHYYVKADGTALWQDREPKPDPVAPVLSFTQKVQAALDAKVADGTLKMAWIQQVAESQRRALVSVVTAANATRQGIVSADAQGKFTIEVI